MLKRSQDVQEIVRKSVFEFLLQLDANEVSVAFSKDNPELFDLVFTSLRDQDPAISRIGLQIISHLLQKTLSDSATQLYLEQQILRNKLQIFKMAIPRSTSVDTLTMLKAL